jgi:hypothetical protein
MTLGQRLNIEINATNTGTAEDAEDAEDAEAIVV